MPGDDEQRVVDADAEPDQGGQDRGHRGDAERVREQGDRDGAAGERGDGGHQRERHAEQRPEGDEDDDRGRDEPEDLAVRWRRPVDLGDRIAAELDLEPGCPRRLCKADDVLDVLGWQFLGELREVDRSEGGLAVAADLGRASGPVGAQYRGHRLGRGDLAQHLLDAGLGRRVVDGPVGGVEDDGRRVAGLLGECRRHEFERLARFGVRQRERGRVGVAHRAFDGDQSDQDRDPGEDDDCAVVEAPASEGSQEGAPVRESLQELREAFLKRVRRPSIGAVTGGGHRTAASNA